VTGGGFLGTHVVSACGEGIEPIVARRRQYDLTRWDDTERLFADAKPELVLPRRRGRQHRHKPRQPGRYWYSTSDGRM
jgi:hypothetical protein